MTAIRILVVDDSIVYRAYWAKAMETQSDFTVVDQLPDGRRVIETVGAKSVDLVILDLDMPEMNGFEVLPLLKRDFPKVKVLVVSSLTIKGSEAVVRALSLGATDYVTKPEKASERPAAAEEIIRKIRQILRPPVRSVLRVSLSAPIQNAPAAIVIGASTGGPNALVTVLKAVGPSITQPILIAQHMPANFISIFARRIEDDCRRPCLEGVHGEVVQPGYIYLAPGDYHMVVERGGRGPMIRLNQNPPENFCRPAVDPLFRSAANVWGSSVLGIVLTGMGVDGREGSRRIVEVGGAVWVQDEESSVVWGMPGAVAEAGLASEILNINEIGPLLTRRF